MKYTNIKRHFSSFVLVMPFLLSTKAHGEEIVIFGFEKDYPPFVIAHDNGEYSGFDIEITQAMCDAVNVTCHFEFYSWNKLLPALENKEIDAIVASMSNTNERKNKLTFTDKYHNDLPKMIKLGKEDIGFTVSDIKGKKIGVKKDTVFDKHLTKLFGNIAEIKRYPTVEYMYKDLLKTNLDFIMAEESSLKFFIDGEDGDDFELFGPSMYSKDHYGTGASIALRKGNVYLADKINLAIKILRDNGEYQKISIKYFGKDIYGL